MGDSKIHRDDLERVIQEHERSVRERLEALKLVPVDRIAAELGISEEVVRAYAKRAGISLIEAPSGLVNPFAVASEPEIALESASPSPDMESQEARSTLTEILEAEHPSEASVESPESPEARADRLDPVNPFVVREEPPAVPTSEQADPERPRWNSLLLVAACTFALIGAGALLRSVWIETRPQRPVYIGEGAARTVDASETRPIPSPMTELDQAQRNRDGAAVEPVPEAAPMPEGTEAAPPISDEEWERARERAAEFAERALERMREEQEAAAARESEARRAPRPTEPLPESPDQDGSGAPETARETPPASGSELPDGPG